MAIPAGTPMSGTRGRVQINGTNIALSKWDATLKQDRDDATTFEDVNDGDGLTYQNDVMGVMRGSGSIEGYWNSANNNMVAGGGGLFAGSLVAAMKLFVDKVGNRGIFFSAARITEVTLGADVGGGKIKFAAKFESYAQWTNIV